MASIFDAFSTAPASAAAQAHITGLNSGYNLATSAIGQGNQDFEEAYRALTSHIPPITSRVLGSLKSGTHRTRARPWSPGMRDKAEVRRCRRGHAAPADRRS
jgi:hypothetical protein